MRRGSKKREQRRVEEREGERPGIFVSNLGQRLTEFQNGRLNSSQTFLEYRKHDRQWVPLLSSSTYMF